MGHKHLCVMSSDDIDHGGSDQINNNDQFDYNDQIDSSDQIGNSDQIDSGSCMYRLTKLWRCRRALQAVTPVTSLVGVATGAVFHGFRVCGGRRTVLVQEAKGLCSTRGAVTRLPRRRPSSAGPGLRRWRPGTARVGPSWRRRCAARPRCWPTSAGDCSADSASAGSELSGSW